MPCVMKDLALTLPPEMSLCGVESQKHAPFFTSVTVAVVTFLFLFLARLLSFKSTHEAY